jgi:hypothetical protein
MSDPSAQLAQVIAKLQRMTEVAREAQQQVIRALGDRYLHVLQDETPEGEGEHPGQLRAAYTTEQRYSQAGASYTISNVTPYLRYVLNGRGPVEASSGKMLRFVINGQVIFRKRVGPAAPNPFADRAAQMMAPEIAAASQELANLIVRGYSG